MKGKIIKLAVYERDLEIFENFIKSFEYDKIDETTEEVLIFLKKIKLCYNDERLKFLEI